MQDPLVSLSSALASAVEAAGTSVVRVEGQRRHSASGIVWDAEHVITAHHALEADERVELGLANGNTVEAKLIGRDPGTDIALLELDASGLAAPRWVELDGVRVGQIALAVTRPGRSARAAFGIVSALGETWRTPSGRQIERYLQPGVSVERGFSGSLLIDATGAALGMNSAGILRGTPVTLPRATLERIVAALLAHGRVRRGYLGVSGYPVRLPPVLAGEAGQRAGLILVGVQPDGPADKAGLLQGDVLIALAGKPIAHVADLQAELDEDRIGRELEARVARAGKLVDFKVAVGTRA